MIQNLTTGVRTPFAVKTASHVAIRATTVPACKMRARVPLSISGHTADEEYDEETLDMLAIQAIVRARWQDDNSEGGGFGRRSDNQQVSHAHHG